MRLARLFRARVGAGLHWEDRGRPRSCCSPEAPRPRAARDDVCAGTDRGGSVAVTHGRRFMWCRRSGRRRQQNRRRSLRIGGERRHGGALRRRPPGKPVLSDLDGIDAASGHGGGRQHVRPIVHRGLVLAWQKDVSADRCPARPPRPHAEQPRAVDGVGVSRCFFAGVS